MPRVAALYRLLCILPAATLVAEPPPATVTLDLDRRAQTIQAWGGSSAWYADDYMDYTDEARAAFVDCLWGLDADGLGLNVHRARVVPTQPPGDGDLIDWSDPRLEQKARFLYYVQERHDPLLMLSCWTPPAWMKTNHQRVGGRLEPGRYDEFARYLVAYLVGLEERFGVEVDILSPQNEPDGVKQWDSCVWTAEELATFIGQHLGPMLEKAKPEVKLLVAEHTKWQTDLHDAILRDPRAEPYVDLVGAHLYHGTHRDPQAFRKAVEKNRPVWQTEFYYGNYRFPQGHAIDEHDRMLRLAEVMHNSLTHAHVNGYFFWWLLTSKDKAEEGLLVAVVNFDQRDPDLPITGWNISKQAHGFGHFSRFVRPGMVRLELDQDPPADGLLISAYIDDVESKITLVAINLHETSQELRLALPFKTEQPITVVVTDSKRSRVKQDSRQSEPDEPKVQLTPRSITTLQIPLPLSASHHHLPH
jgi:glucuronoarabinoxylan endo-1,4-beta-xylanase